MVEGRQHTRNTPHRPRHESCAHPPIPPRPQGNTCHHRRISRTCPPPADRIWTDFLDTRDPFPLHLRFTYDASPSTPIPLCISYPHLASNLADSLGRASSRIAAGDDDEDDLNSDFLLVGVVVGFSER